MNLNDLNRYFTKCELVDDRRAALADAHTTAGQLRAAMATLADTLSDHTDPSGVVRRGLASMSRLVEDHADGLHRQSTTNLWAQILAWQVLLATINEMTATTVSNA